jgi:type I restriction enzyme, R subunit
LKIALADEDAEIEPVPIGSGGYKSEPEMDKLSNIIKTFNDLFGNIPWKDKEQIEQVIAYEIPKRVAADRAYQNAKLNSDEQNARIEHDRALQRVVVDLLSDQTELYKQFSGNESFKKWLTDNNFWLTYETQATQDATPNSFPILQAQTFIQQQFGSEPNWAKINTAIWDYFITEHDKRLGLSGIHQIAIRLEVSVDDILSVVSLLTGPNQDYLRRIYYREPEPGKIELLSGDEVIRQTRRWYYEKAIDESEWRKWAGEVLVGWEPAMKTPVEGLH